jgi:hypothetical protein
VPEVLAGVPKSELDVVMVVGAPKTEAVDEAVEAAPKTDVDEVVTEVELAPPNTGGAEVVVFEPVDGVPNTDTLGDALKADVALAASVFPPKMVVFCPDAVVLPPKEEVVGANGEELDGEGFVCGRDPKTEVLVAAEPNTEGELDEGPDPPKMDPLVVIAGLVTMGATAEVATGLTPLNPPDVEVLVSPLAVELKGRLVEVFMVVVTVVPAEVFVVVLVVVVTGLIDVVETAGKKENPPPLLDVDRPKMDPVVGAASDLSLADLSMPEEPAKVAVVVFEVADASLAVLPKEKVLGEVAPASNVDAEPCFVPKMEDEEALPPEALTVEKDELPEPPKPDKGVELAIFAEEGAKVVADVVTVAIGFTGAA